MSFIMLEKGIFWTMERAALQPRLLICLYGLGTNAGLKRMNAEEHGVDKPAFYCPRVGEAGPMRRLDDAFRCSSEIPMPASARAFKSASVNSSAQYSDSFIAFPPR